MSLAYTNTSRKLRRSVSAFEPSVYSTGTQAVRPYTPAWSEGVEYGSSWFDYTPMGWAYSKLTGAAKAAGEVVGAGATRASSALTGAAKAAAEIYERHEADKAAAEEAAREAAAAEKRKQILAGVGVLVAGVTGVVLVQRYRKTGKVF